MTAYSALGIVKLSRTSLVFGGFGAAGGATGGAAGDFVATARGAGDFFAAALRGAAARLAGVRDIFLAGAARFVGMVDIDQVERYKQYIRFSRLPATVPHRGPPYRSKGPSHIATL